MMALIMRARRPLRPKNGMLVELSIKDFAIIEGLKIQFGPGLNIFTGETGAGKSIIMDAISLILGDRASNDIIRLGRDEAQVEALFDIGEPKGLALENVLNEAGIPFSGDLVIKRVVQRAGRNRIYINGSLATLVTLTEVGRHLIDIYGQSEHQSLTRPEEHVEILDGFGVLEKLRSHMSVCYKEFSGARKELDALLQANRDSAGRREFLEFQMKELSDAAIQPGEEDRLKREKERLRNSEKIRAVTAQAEEGIYSGTGSVVERLGSMVKALKDVSALDERLSPTVESLQASLYQIEDGGSFLRDYVGSLEADPEGLDLLEMRLDTINRLKKKHAAATIDELIEKTAAIGKELSLVADFDEASKGLEARLAKAREKALEASKHLSDARAAAAKVLEEKMEAELASLGFKGAVFEVSIVTEAGPDSALRVTEKGADRVNFLISTNPGEGIKPLSRIASGGELSRIMLAMKSVAASGRVPSLIFDEIDTGVGGAMAQVVGLKLKEVSASHQVICITHLPQIAAFAERHFAVEKKPTEGGRTVTSVSELAGPDDKVEQISKMLGGLKVTDTTRKHASELVETAGRLASSIHGRGGGNGRKKQA